MIAKALHDLRIAHGYTQGVVSERTGLSISFLSDLERGRTEPSLKTLCAIAAVYGMGAGDLLVFAGYTADGDKEHALRNAARGIARQALERALDALEGGAK